MTHAERAVIEQATTRPLSWASHADPHFVVLSARPCPLLNEDDTCSVYAVRPFNCRRFLCGRDEGEPWSGERRVVQRLHEDRAFRRLYARTERKAQRWSVKNGWSA